MHSDKFNFSKIEDLNYLKYVFYYFIEFNLIPALIDKYRDYRYSKIESFNESILTDESYFSQFFKYMTFEKIKIQKKIFLIVYLKSFMISEKNKLNLYVVMQFFMLIVCMLSMNILH